MFGMDFAFKNAGPSQAYNRLFLGGNYYVKPVEKI